MNDELRALREKMKEYGIDAYLIPTTDFHGSEYVNDYFKCRKYISGFTGSAGDMVVTADDARLWTDSRYFLQAAEQLKDREIGLMKLGQPDVPSITEFLADNLVSGSVLGFDGRIVSTDTGIKMEEQLASKGVKFSYDQDLVGMIWNDRPAINPGKIIPLPIESAGRTTIEKLGDMIIGASTNDSNFRYFFPSDCPQYVRVPISDGSFISFSLPLSRHISLLQASFNTIIYNLPFI